MWVLTTLLLLAPSGGQAAALEKPTLSLHPPWTTIFKGERVTLRCDGARPLVLELRPVSTLWYRGHLLLPSHGTSIEVQAPGVYRCQTRGAPVSDPVHLSVSSDWLILQAPHAAVFEGDPLVLRCRGWRDRAVHRLLFLRDGRAVGRGAAAGAAYSVPRARAADSGRYRCSGTVRVPAESAPVLSAAVAVTVQELFPAPVLRAVRRVPGGGVVLRCDTRLHPRAPRAPLRFAFYESGRAVRRFGPAAEFTVPGPEAAALASHWCEAATASRSVRKRSAWPPLAGRGPAPDAATAAAWAPAHDPPPPPPPPAPEPPGAASGPEATRVPDAPAGRAGPACARPEAPGPDVDRLLREMRLLRGLLSRVLELGLEPRGARASPGRRATPPVPGPGTPGTPGTPRTPETAPAGR